MKGKKIELIEISPRDGYQILKTFIPTEIKKDMIDRIADSGVRSIQVTSFVKAIEQMKDAPEIAAYCFGKYPHLNLSALAPNRFGARLAVEAGFKEINFVICVSRRHNMQNAKRTLDQSFDELASIIQEFPHVNFVLDVASAFGYYEDDVTLSDYLEFLKTGYKIGVRSFNVCDSIGIADPGMVRERVKAALAEFPDCRFDIHIHDTRNMGVACTLAAIESGITRIQTTLGGLGGCPFAHGASGNTSSEDMVFMLHRMGYDTGIDFDRLLAAARYQTTVIDGNYSGHNIRINLNQFTRQ